MRWGACEGGVQVNTRFGQRTEVGAAATAVDETSLAEVVAGVVKRVERAGVKVPL